MSCYRSIVKEVRKTLVIDIYITLARIVQICNSRYVKSMTAESADAAFELMKLIGDGLCVAETEKQFRVKACKQENVHILMDLYDIAMNISKEVIEKSINVKSTEHLAKLVRKTFISISKLECDEAVGVQTSCVYLWIVLLKSCDTRDKAEFMEPVVIDLLKTIQNIDLTKSKNGMNKMTLLESLWTLFKTSEKPDKMIEVGYLFIAFYPSESKQSLNYIVHWTTKAIKDLNGSTVSVKTPYDYFVDMRSQFYNLKLPSDFDLGEFARNFFKYSILTDEDEMTQKYIQQMLMRADMNRIEKDPMKCLRFIYYVSIFHKEDSERIETILSSLMAKYKKKRDIELGLLITAITYRQYLSTLQENSQKYKDIHLSEELSDQNMSLSNSVLRQFNFDYETKELYKLKFMAKAYAAFIDFYMDKTEAERERFEDEKQFISRSIKMVANQFVVRGYKEYGLKLHWHMFKFAKATNDEFGILDCGSHFAQYSADFQMQYSQSEDLNKIIEYCNDVAKRKLICFDDLSAKYQNQVLNFLLNLVLYWHEDDSDHKDDISKILLFVAYTIGGIDGKSIESVSKVNIERPLQKNTFNGVRMKFYAVLFTMITRYGIPNPLDPFRFMAFILRYLKENINVATESTYQSCIMILEMLSDMVMYCQYRYLSTPYNSLLSSMLKFVLRLGFTQRTAEIIHLQLLIDLQDENMSTCKVSLFEFTFVY